MCVGGCLCECEFGSVCPCVCVSLSQRFFVSVSVSVSVGLCERARHGGFVSGAELADTAAFAISPAEAAAMDPCQRLLLERGYGALHDAALDRAALGGSLTGVFLGFAGTEFSQVLAASPAGASVYAATGATCSIASGRLSYALGLQGPCVTYDTACSAALVACHGGLRALQLDECPLGLVSGVNLMIAPGVSISFAISGMTSVRGRSHTFDARADGFARGEACGALVLGSSVDANHVSVCGSAVRQDGRSASLTAPNGQAQRGLLVAALSDAGREPDALALVEAHGTGTALGDPIEGGSLGAAVLKARDATAGVSSSTPLASSTDLTAALKRVVLGHVGSRLPSVGIMASPPRAPTAPAAPTPHRARNRDILTPGADASLQHRQSTPESLE